MNSDAVHVVCLCAAWCRLCDSYGAVFDAVLKPFEASQPTLRKHWIDIEDEAALVGDLDIETFPTLVIVDGSGLRFAGPLTPHPETLQRVLRSTLAQPVSSAAAVEPEWAAFAERLLSSARG
jgi:thioredoxin 1